MSNPKWDDTQEISPSWDSTQEAMLPAIQEEEAYDPGSFISGARGLGQGLSLGYSDELVGALQGLTGKLTGEEGDLAELYREYRDIERAKNLASEEAHPWLYGGGNVAGGLATALVPGAAIGTGLKGALAAGALAAGGTSEADLTQGETEGLAKDVAGGAVLGGALHGAGTLAGKGLKFLSETQPVESFSKGFSQGAKGVNLASQPQLRETEKKLFEKTGELSDELLSLLKGKEGKGGLVGQKSDLVKALTEEGKTVDLSKAVSQWDKLKKDVDFESLSETAKKEFSLIDDYITNTLKNKKVTEQFVRKLEESHPRIPSSSEELLQKAQTEAALRRQAGETVEPRLLNAMTPQGEMQQAALLAKTPEGELLQRLGSPQTARAEAPAFTSVTPYAEDITSNIAIDPTKIPLKTAETVRESIQDIASKELTSSKLTGAARSTAKEVAGSIREQIPEIKDINKKIQSINQILETFNIGKDITDELGNKIDVATIFERMEKEGITGARARQLIEDGFKNLEQIQPELAKKFKDELGNLVEQFTLAKQIQAGGLYQVVSPKSAPPLFGNLLGRITKPITDNEVISPIIKNTQDSLKNVREAYPLVSPRLGAIQQTLSAKDTKSADIQKANELPEISKSLYQASNDELKQVSVKLLKNPNLGSLSKALMKALEQGNQQSKNAVLFSILQNPLAREELKK